MLGILLHLDLAAPLVRLFMARASRADPGMSPHTLPVVPDREASFAIGLKRRYYELIVAREEAVLSIESAPGMSAAWVGQRDPVCAAPVKVVVVLVRETGLVRLDKVEGKSVVGVVADHVGPAVDKVDSQTGLLEDGWWFGMPAFCE